MKKTEAIMVLILGTILVIGISISTGSIHVYAKEIWDDDDTMEELVDDIEDGRDDDDNINWEEFKDSNVYEQEDSYTQKCIEEREDLGNNLADYEISRCFDDYNYYK